MAGTLHLTSSLEHHDAKRRAGLSQGIGPRLLVIGVILLKYLCTMLGMNGLAGVQCGVVAMEFNVQGANDENDEDDEDEGDYGNDNFESI
jgi:hypothetical protein